ncbi:translocation/assembly module TamB [Thalassobaculum fulvum]|uniref:Translocation/assembly module TamB n=1 Tax=Thalassobaculum fulvum TaxID=1633335 RepID=A0A918XTB5_9PROT|nr:translocation/assembly module TamB [Thalassobaculum fulvum]
MRRRVLIAVALVVGLPFAVAAAAVGIANTGWGRAWVASTVAAATADGPVRVRIDRIAGALPVRIDLQGVRLADRSGEFAALDRVRLAWSPLALLGGTVAVDAVEVDGGRVLRVPETGEPATPEPAAAPSLKFPAPPVAIRLSMLRVAGLALDRGLAGQAATLDAELQASLTGVSAIARGWMTASGNGGTGRLDLDLAVVPASGTLRAELRASEPEGGLVAGLLGLPDRPPLSLTLTGDGTLAAWKGRLAGGLGAGAETDLGLSVSAAAAGTRVAVDGTAAVQRLVPDVVGPLLGPSVELGLTALVASDGAMEVQRLAARAAAGSLDGTARIDPAGRVVAAGAAVTTPDLGRFSGLAGVDLAGSATATLTLQEGGRRVLVTVTGDPAAGPLRLTGLRAELAASADAALPDLPAAISWTLAAGVDTPALPDADLVALVGPRLTLEAAGTADTRGEAARVDRLTVTTDAGRLETRAILSDGRRLAADGTVDIADLGRLSGLAGRPLAGSATLGFDGSVLLDPLDLSAVLDLAADGLDPGDPMLAALIGSGPTATAGVTLDAADRLSLHGIALQAAAVRADGDLELDLSAGALHGRIDLTAPDLAAVGRALDLDLSGSGVAAVALGGTLEAPAASASWQVSALRVQGTTVDRLAGTATAVGLPDAPSGRVDLRAALGGETVTAGARYALAGDRLTVDGLAVDGAGLQARGDLAVALGGPAIDGALTVAAADLGRLAAAGVPLAGGALDARVTLDGRNGQSARLAGTVTGLALEGGTVEVARVDLSGAGRDLLKRPVGSLTLTARGVRRNGAALLETAELAVDSDGAAARAALTAKGGAGKPFDLSATASAALSAAPMQASVESFEAGYRDVRVSLERPTRIVLGRQPRFDDLALAVDGGRITGSGRFDPSDLDLAVAARGLPAGLARLADPTLKLSGGIDADLTVRGPVGNPAVRLTIDAPGVRSDDPDLADLPPLQASAEVTVESRTLRAALDATVGDGAQASLRATAGLTPGADGGPPTLDETSPLQARIDAEAVLERLAAFLPLRGGRIVGQAAVHVAVAGTPADPQVTGDATVKDGALDQPGVGLYLRDIELDAKGRGERLVIETLTATAAGGGTLAGSGGLSFDITEKAPADLRVEARQLRVVDTDQAEITIDADLTLQGALPEYRLAGTVTVLPSEIRIPDQLPPSVVDLPVTEIRDGVVIRTPQAEVPEEKTGRAPVRLDVRVAIPGQVFIRGRGLDSEWGGELAVTGKADAPAVDGALEVRRGQFGLAGRTFEFRRGRVVFDGGPPSDPALDMLLTAEVAEILAKVRVGGRAQDPTIDLSSEPALPEEEVLSRVLFGSPRAQLSPLQALKLAQSAAVLSGRFGAGGGGITDTVRETLGVDTLDVDTGVDSEGSRGASLSVGKYVAPGVFLRLQQGLSGASSKAVVEVELTDNVTVETDIGADSESRVGVNWKLDY